MRRQPHNRRREHPVGTRRNQEHADGPPLPPQRDHPMEWAARQMRRHGHRPHAGPRRPCLPVERYLAHRADAAGQLFDQR
ncbi:hypothetical protein MBOL_23700 [Mycobacteroides abscessus subsp. bolletii BD]|nr:hypothetical protein MMAS_23620 [Mycobacteroides abscessus subsp. massiliense CCUG 48898 = JCM 15300]EHM19304.1 hypothetical protein MBOL_23700 [Mycobacteroides abscessus subsp. bolletii BD]